MVDVKNIDITYRFNIFLCLNQFFFTSYNVLGTHNGFCIQYNIICYTLGTTVTMTVVLEYGGT